MLLLVLVLLLGTVDSGVVATMCCVPLLNETRAAGSDGEVVMEMMFSRAVTMLETRVVMLLVLARPVVVLSVVTDCVSALRETRAVGSNREAVIDCVSVSKKTRAVGSNDSAVMAAVVLGATNVPASCSIARRSKGGGATWYPSSG
ncbi:hypothetical protein GMOD_00004086 [Pyrenophora seminiperda CCB06]|uniref:Secreted protein n=1 Tax=Pyrenophora seminiperda CCB06 TaxID=1302712 RepID=A0A3M7M0E7_9PLEO|nr:hypothetical protein GMOD_00004086 [Pyrenophora seminiperda CCB06]